MYNRKKYKSKITIRNSRDDDVLRLAVSEADGRDLETDWEPARDSGVGCLVKSAPPGGQGSSQ